MPTYVFNKLVRDKLYEEYEKLNQKASYIKLTDAEFAAALKEKLMEEIKEIDVEDKISVINELADVYQVTEEIMKVYKITPEEVEKVKQTKFEKKGGFSRALYVKSLEISDTDPWNEYFRKQPDVFIEIDKEK